MRNPMSSNDSLHDNSDRLRRVIEHADASVAGWSADKQRDATLTFYSRSDEASRGNCDLHQTSEENRRTFR
jgi:hypothetical protein